MFQREERKGEALSAVEMFKSTHYSQKKGFSQEVKQAIVSHSVPHENLCMLSVLLILQGHVILTSSLDT